MSRPVSTYDFERHPELVKAYCTLSAAIANGNDQDLLRCLKDYIDTAHRFGLLVGTAVATKECMAKHINDAKASKPTKAAPRRSLSKALCGPSR